MYFFLFFYKKGFSSFKVFRSCSILSIGNVECLVFFNFKLINFELNNDEEKNCC